VTREASQQRLACEEARLAKAALQSQLDEANASVRQLQALVGQYSGGSKGVRGAHGVEPPDEHVLACSCVATHMCGSHRVYARSLPGRVAVACRLVWTLHACCPTSHSNCVT
jgi:hypothetical protein